MKTYTSLTEIAKDVLMIQNASNIQAILNTWAAMQTLVREDAALRKLNYNRHPVNVLMLSKVSSLLVVNASAIGVVTGQDDRDLFMDAYKWAQQKIDEKKAEAAHG